MATILERYKWGVAVLLVAVIATVIYFQGQMSSGGPTPPAGTFVSNDDGKTYFATAVDFVSPSIIDGKLAVRAHVFTCGKDKWVGYLERYTEKGKALVEKSRQKAAAGNPQPMPPMLLGETEIKRPGDATWIRQSNLAAAAKIFDVRCPGEPQKRAMSVLP